MLMASINSKAPYHVKLVHEDSPLPSRTVDALGVFSLVDTASEISFFSHARRPQTLIMYLLFGPPLRVKLRPRFELPRIIPPYCGDIRKAVFEQWIHQQNTY